MILGVGVIFAGIVTGIGWYSWGRIGDALTGTLGGGAKDDSLVVTAKRGAFYHEITANGNIESASNVDVRCEVEGGGLMILTVIDEGTYVEEGDILCELNSADLEERLLQQQIICNGSQAAVTQAKADLDTAKIAREEYVEGTFPKEVLALENKIFKAKEDERRALEELDYSNRLFARGYVTQMQVEADEYLVEQARRDRKIAELELKALQEYTKAKELTRLDSSIETSQAHLASEEHSHQLDIDKRDLIEDQIEKCTIVAPAAGQVVYKNEQSYRGGDTFVIEEGATVRERQILFMLPDPKQMQVKSNVNETHVALVRKGLPTTVRVEAMSDKVFTGEVKSVAEYPMPTHWMNGNVKEYETVVTIDDPEVGLRPGLTAEVRILVNSLEDVLTVPVQCVFEHGGAVYAILHDEDRSKWRAVEVQVGPTNDKLIVIEDGIKEGDRLVSGAARFRDSVEGLPEIDPLAAEDNANAERRRGRPDGAPEQASEGNAERGAGAGGRAGGSGGMDPARMFTSMDANKNDKLEKSELPPPMQAGFDEADADKDGGLSKAELAVAVAKMRESRPAAGGPPRGERPEGAGPNGGGQPRGERPGGGGGPNGGGRPAGGGSQ